MVQVLWVHCSSRDPTNSVRTTLNETQSTDPNQLPGFILYSSPPTLLRLFQQSHFINFSFSSSELLRAETVSINCTVQA